MSIILVHPPAVPGTIYSRNYQKLTYMGAYKKYLNKAQYYSFPMEHLGIMSIKSYSDSYNLPIHIINGINLGHYSIEQTFNAIKTITQKFGSPELIGFSNIDTYEEVLWLINKCKTEWESVAIAIGNLFATLNYEKILNSYKSIDFVCIGEGERSFTMLSKSLLNGTTFENVLGIAWRDQNNTIKKNAPSILDIEDIPWVDRNELPVVLKEGFAASIFTTRGCPYGCTFCATGTVSKLLKNNSYRLRSINSVIDEIEFLYKKFKINFITIVDDLFLMNNPDSTERAIQFANQLIKRKLKITFMFDTRADCLNIDLFRHLYKAGLRRIFVGIETGDENQLAAYKKKYNGTIENLSSRLKTVQDLGIEIIPGVMTFHPTVKPAELRQTHSLMQVLTYRSVHSLYDRVTAYCGTILYDEYKKKGYLSEEWPVGKWEFTQKETGEAYYKIRNYILNNSKITFEEASSFFLDCVTELEQL